MINSFYELAHGLNVMNVATHGLRTGISQFLRSRILAANDGADFESFSEELFYNGLPGFSGGSDD